MRNSLNTILAWMIDVIKGKIEKNVKKITFVYFLGNKPRFGTFYSLRKTWEITSIFISVKTYNPLIMISFILYDKNSLQ